MYELAVETIDGEHRIWPGFLRSPDSIMYRAVQAMDLFTVQLRRLRKLADDHAGEMSSPRLTRFFRMLRAELDDAYFATVDDHLHRLRFKHGVLISVRLGQGAKNTGYVLRRPHPKRRWRDRLTGDHRPSYTYRVPDRDEAGARALADIRERGINLAADALARSSDHILGFFTMLRRELAFYVGCLSLHQRLTTKTEPLCFPTPLPPPDPVLIGRGLYDPCLSLRRDERVVGNDVDANGAGLVAITGANEGGKSTFLPRPGSMVLFNESFAATNEREGSQIARQVIHALLDSEIKVLIVTHLYDLAHGLHQEHADDAVFLRAQRQADGARTFRLQRGEPLPTGFGEDLYQQVFGVKPHA